MTDKDNLNLLIIEDDDTIVAQFKEILEQYNKNEETLVKIDDIIKQNVEEGLKAIKENYFDGAVIDLKLSTSDSKESGNEIIREIKKTMRFPVIVYSGYLQDLDSELK